MILTPSTSHPHEVRHPLHWPPPPSFHYSVNLCLSKALFRQAPIGNLAHTPQSSGSPLYLLTPNLPVRLSVRIRDQEGVSQGLVALQLTLE